MPTTPTLYLHIGHDKTGSSFIQSTLALNDEALKANGIHYPSVGNFSKARQGFISNGNWAAFDDPAASIKAAPPQCHATLFSSEGIFARLATPQHFVTFTGMLDRLAIEKVNVLLFIRDPIDHISSEYQQKIKRGGEHLPSIDDYSHTYKMPTRVRKLLALFEEKPVFDVTIRNYSRVRDGILPIFSEWLGLPADALNASRLDQVVNRSLTQDELYIQRRLNMHLGRSGELVADRLCNLLPQVESSLSLPGPDAQREMLARLAEDIAAVNARVEPGHAYALEVVEGEDRPASEALRLSEEQANVIIDGLAEEIASLRQANAKLRKTLEANRKRDKDIRPSPASDKTSRTPASGLQALAARFLKRLRVR